MQQVSYLKRTVKAVKRRPLLFAVPVIIDLLFLFALGFLMSPFFLKIEEILSLLGTRLIEATGVITAGAVSDYFIKDIIEYSPDIKTYTFMLFGVLAMLLGTIYLLFTVFQSASWYVCHRITGSQVKYHELLLHVAGWNLVWMLLFGMIHLADMIVRLNMVIATPQGVIPQAGAGLIIAQIMLAYFVFLPYAQKTGLKKTMRIEFTGRYLLSWTAIIIVFAAVILIQSILPLEFLLAYQVLVTLPIAAAMKIFLIYSLRDSP